MMTAATMRDETITLNDTDSRDLPQVCEIEQGDGRHFILPYSLEKHREEFAKPTVIYKSIRRVGRLVGFVILVLDPDGLSVEFRRIVVAEPGRGIGTRAVELVRDACKRELGRSRVWLDVFESNARARHMYEKCGYAQFGSSEHEGRTLLLYETSTEGPLARPVGS
jgi:RimJ/RimL family protein N-acetyltransferase